MDVHIGRQPLFDRAHRVVGHELLFRDADVAHARVLSGTAASAQVLLASFELGLGELVGQGLAFVNMPRPFLVGGISLPVGPEHLVLEVLEDVGHDDELLAGLRTLRAQGYRLALDDFVWDEQTVRLLPAVDIVKIDVLQHGDALSEVVGRVHDAGLRVVAEKVETPEQLSTCRALGVEWYQGYLLQRPQTLRGRTLSPGQAASLQLVRALDRPDVSMREIAEIVGGDPALAYRLLRAANSAAVGSARRVTGLTEALVLLGAAQVRRWALLLLLADLPSEAAAGVEAALLRASMCELLARQLPAADAGEAFVVGLVSSLDGLLAQPMPELLRQLPLASATEAALLTHQGPLGEVLACVKAYEQGEPAVPAGSGLSAAVPRQSFVEAVRTAGGQREVVAATPA